MCIDYGRNIDFVLVGSAHKKSVLYRSQSVVDYLDQISTSTTPVEPDSQSHPVCDRKEAVLIVPKNSKDKIEPFEIVG